MKAFNIEEAKQNQELIIYRDGTKPVEVLFPKTKDEYSKILTVTDYGNLITHYESGSFHSNKECHLDLFLQEQYIVMSQKGTVSLHSFSLETAQQNNSLGGTIYKLTKI